MDVKNKNIVNIFNPAKINNQSIVLFMFAFLPAAFVTKTIESTLVYLLLSLIFLILNTFVSKVINLTVSKELKFIVVPLVVISLTILVSLFSKAVFINYSNEFNKFTYLMAVSSLPYLLSADNKELSIGKGLVNTIQTFVGFGIVMVMIAFFREFLGTGGFTFGKYTSIKFSWDLFSKYAISILQNPYGVLIILGFIVALVNRRGEES